ncbi:type IV toxin-antitoxin system AbiEi family antitoxin domain-containing protein [Microbacterium sp. 1P10UB]
MSASAAARPANTDVPRSFTYQELRRVGFTRRKIDHLLATGRLHRLRKGFYVPSDIPSAFRRAGELGGRTDCLSLLRHLGVFVLDHSVLHVQLNPWSGRLPPPTDEVIRHWRASTAAPGDLGTGAIEALVQACRCQPPRAAVATLDSAWHLGLISETHLDQISRRCRIGTRFSGLC